MKRWISYGILLAAVPAAVLVGALAFRGKQAAWFSLLAAGISCVPFFLRFEREGRNGERLMLVAAMAALAVAGRILFAALPGVKPVTALVVVTAMYFGGEAGFMTGALAAVVSNFYFGQGPWTLFQMLAWGLIGLGAGALAGPLKRSRAALAGYAAAAGVFFSLFMDVWSVLWADGYFNLARYAGFVLSSAKFTAVYAVSNVVLLLALAGPMGRVLERLKGKYGC